MVLKKKPQFKISKSLGRPCLRKAICISLARWSLNNFLWGSFVFDISSQIFVNACLLDQSIAASGLCKFLVLPNIIVFFYIEMIEIEPMASAP